MVNIPEASLFHSLYLASVDLRREITRTPRIKMTPLKSLIFHIKEDAQGCICASLHYYFSFEARQIRRKNKSDIYSVTVFI